MRSWFRGVGILAALRREAKNSTFLATLLRNPINPKRLKMKSYSKAPQRHRSFVPFRGLRVQGPRVRSLGLRE